MLVSLDVYRPAAQEQLKILADNNNILNLPIVQNQQPSEIASRAMNTANLNGADVIIFDTAGRTQIDLPMMTEVKQIKSLGMIIHYHNRSKLSDDKENGATFHKDLKSLMSVADVLSVCCPATKETTNLINKQTLEYLPTGAVVTNVARGDIVDDKALIEALNSRKVYAVGLDVYQGEPNLNPGYLKHKSAFILPHLGSASKQTRTAMGNLAIDNIDEFFKTGSCKNKVN